ncbi:hypothetical protein ADL22_23610 [Streptomyces sp. NRRL F-4489]|uniref:hypothetical protein n=1 Tax=Streptomyces sp. NRRL F-4489 TaxID=1609095 RepID=UPI00074A82D1|nr:hypothetical protein [Streptomyces sp. NRRL F-4489]KUL36884.1 hypothetical protein ADL22_23610 [Streptomyces sp. NRRL F-4489]
MSKNPQQPSVRRSKKGATVQDAAENKAGSDRAVGPGGSRKAHGSDKGAKGGGRGGGVPEEQRPDHP